MTIMMSMFVMMVNDDDDGDDDDGKKSLPKSRSEAAEIVFSMDWKKIKFIASSSN